MKDFAPLASTLVLAIALAVQAGAQETTPSTAAPAAVSGEVASSQGETLAGATVIVAPAAHDPWRATRAWTAQTNAQGAFTVSGLPPGRYTVTARKAGYTSRELAAADPGLPADAQAIALDQGQETSGLRITLHPAGRIAGLVSHADGRPAAGAEVIAGPADRGIGMPEAVGRAVTGQDGRYELRDLPIGAYAVTARAGASSRSDDVWKTTTRYPGVTLDEAGEPVTVAAGQTTANIDIPLLPVPERHTLGGQVFDPAGRVLRGVTVDYRHEDGRTHGVWMVSAPDGSFSIDTLPPGRVALLARAESSDGPLEGAATVDLGDGGIADLRLTVDRPGTVAGRIVGAGAGGVPAGVTFDVSLVHRAPAVSALHPVEQAMVRGDGRFRLPHAAGEMEFRVRANGGWVLREVRRGGRVMPGRRVTVAPGELIEDVELVVGRGDGRRQQPAVAGRPRAD